MRLSSLVYVTLVLVLLSALPAAAQPAAAKPASAKPRWGVEVGGGVSYLTVPKGTSRGMGGDISGGVFVNVPFISVYRLQPELRFDHRESKVRGTRRKFDYLDIPILVNIKLFKGLFMSEGPAFHVPLRAKVGSVDAKSNTRADISMVMGVGVKAGTKVRIEGRWDSGLKGTQKTVVSGDVPTRHRSITGVISIDLSK